MSAINLVGNELLAIRPVLNSAVSQAVTVPNVFSTFLEGLLSCIAPCVLPLVPGYLSYISGISMPRMASTAARAQVSAMPGAGGAATATLVETEDEIPPVDVKKVFFSSLLFVAGFTTIFILFFGFFNFILDTVGDIRTPARVIGGLLVILFGLHFLGVFRLGFLNMEKRFNLNRVKPASFVGAYFLGAAFAFGWTPCVGPFLTTAIFTAEQGSAGDGFILMLVYSAGLGIPFVLAGLFFNRFLGFMATARRHFQVIEIASGLLLLVIGLLLLTNNLTALTQQLSTFRFF